MFENLLGQAGATASLRSDYESGCLPPSLLFDGPPLSAKATAALEIARASSCKKTAAWNCTCDHCLRHRILSHPDTLLFGPKSLREELAAGADLLARSPSTPARYFFVRAARKLMKRFDQELFAGEEGKLSKALPMVRSIMEGADACMPSNISDDEVAKTAAKLLPVCMKLHDLVPDATPVYQIRAMEFWARQTPVGPSKTIIIEHADRMLDASRNALLKILEEPPQYARFVLTTVRKRALIPTILSRVRPYRFLVRNTQDAHSVLERVFRLQGKLPPNLDTYLAGFRPSGSSELFGAARNFAAALAADRGRACGGFRERPLAELADGSNLSVATALAEAASATGNFGSSNDALSWSFQVFLDETGKVFSMLLRDAESGLETLRTAERFAALSGDALLRYSSYNLNPVALAERLASAMSEVDE